MTIERRVRERLNHVLASCVAERTRIGVEKYGQLLDDNDQPQRARVVHLMQELMDGMQYAEWAGLPHYATALAEIANLLQIQFEFTAQEIMAGGKK